MRDVGGEAADARQVLGPRHRLLHAAHVGQILKVDDPPDDLAGVV